MGDLRKVQRTPSGTFFVCLPKEWALRYGLERRSIVSLSETSEGKLLVDPEYNVTPAPRTATLTAGPYLNREIIGRYLLGFDAIRVEAKNGISFEIRETVKTAVSRLIGLEIVEEDYSAIVLQCLLEPSKSPPEKNLRRGYSIAAGMHRDGVNALIDGDLHLAKDIMARDDEVNRQYFLLVRMLRTIIQNPSLSESLGVRPIDCLDYRLAGSLVEAIGDECVQIAAKAVELKGTKLSKELKKALVSLHSCCFEAHEKAVKAFIAGEIGVAEEVRDLRGTVETAFASIEKMAKEQSIDVVPHILAVTSLLKQIYEHSVDIADLVMPKKE
jgi:phosphate uptake regulator